ncbi:MAG: hypothetical protein IJ917_07125 [Firmicutes bacterium]|nr:hypothetical protein [Bacillota bacterium]
MKIWRLVAGILSVILCMLVTFQSCAAGVVNALDDNGGSSGSAGLLVAILMLAGGIVSIAVRKSTGKGGSIALIIIFGLAALTGFAGHGNYSDLVIWAGWCLINAVLAFIALFIVKKPAAPDQN